MRFVNPGLLYGLLAAGLPVLIYLLFRRYQPVAWGAMEILRRAIRKQSRRMILQDILLLVLRTLTLILIALVLARPILTAGAAWLGGAPSVVILLDNSLSMAQRSAGASRLEIGRQKAGEALSHLPEGTNFSVVSFSDEAKVLEATPTQDRIRLNTLLEDTPLTSRGTNPIPALQEAREILKKADTPEKWCLIVSDAQCGGWNPEDVSLKAAARRLAGETRIRFLPVRPDSTDNAFLTNPGIEGKPVMVDREVLLSVLPGYHGQEPMEDVPVELAIDDTVEKRTFVTLSGDPAERVTFRHVFREPGLKNVEFRLQTDHLPEDNCCALALEIPRDLPVLIVSDRLTWSGEPSEADYVRAVLTPPEEGGNGAAFPFRVTAIEQGNLSYQNLNECRAILLTGVSHLPEKVFRDLLVFAQGGGSLFLLPGEDPIPSQWASFFGEDELGTFDHWETLSEEEPSVAELELPDHPVLRPFSQATLRQNLAEIRFFKGLDISLPQDSPFQVLLSAKEPGGVHPVLLEGPVGDGKVILLLTALNDEWTNLHLHPSFVVLLYQAVLYLTGGGERTKTTLAGIPWEVPLDIPDLSTTGSLVNPQGRHIPIEPYILSPGPEEKPTVKFPGTDSAGFYSLRFGNLKERERLLAVNPPPVESDLTCLEDDEIRSLFEDPKTVPAEAELAFVTDKDQNEVWRPLLLAALLVLLFESLLTSLMGITRPASGGRS